MDWLIGLDVRCDKVACTGPRGFQGKICVGPLCAVDVHVGLIALPIQEVSGHCYAKLSNEIAASPYGKSATLMMHHSSNADRSRQRELAVGAALNDAIPSFSQQVTLFSPDAAGVSIRIWAAIRSFDMGLLQRLPLVLLSLTRRFVRVLSY
jgi:hypothetical protein